MPHQRTLLLTMTCALGSCASAPEPASVILMPESRSADPLGPAPDPAAAGCPASADLGMVVDIAPYFNDKRPTLVWVGAQPAGLAASEVEHATRRQLKPEERLADPASGLPVWVLGDAAQPPCKLSQGAPILITGSEPWERYPIVATELIGTCDLSRRGRIATRQAKAPTDCQLVEPSAVDGPALVDSMAAPAELRAAFNAASCTAPCSFSRKISGGTSPTGQRLEWSAAAHVHVTPGEDNPCAWPHEDYLSLLAQDRDGVVSQHESLGLSELMLERGRIVGFLDRNLSYVDVWSWPSASAPKLERSITFSWSHEEDSEELALSPYCGP